MRLLATLRRRRGRGRRSVVCRRAVELMTDYLEAALPPLDRRRFEAHLSGCTPCLTYLDQMRATVGAVGHVELETVPPDVLEALVIVFRRYHDGELE